MSSPSFSTTSTRGAINGLGRIGRAILRLVIDEPSFELVAINLDLRSVTSNENPFGQKSLSHRLIERRQE